MTSALEFEPGEGLPDFSVTELCELFNRIFKEMLPPTVWVRGEVVKLRDHRNGHQYFDLVERDDRGNPKGTLSCSLLSWNRRGVDALLKSRADLFAEGVEVRIGGRPKIFAGTGRLTFEMTALDAEFTAGVKALRRTELLRALETEGLLHANRVFLLPALVTRIALITSVGSAAHEDFLAELRESGWAFHISTRDTAMQGRGAAEQIAVAIDSASRSSARPDAIVIVRGGGSTSDLSTFDDERVARAIATCQVPVIVGIGHEVDTSVADEVAFASFKTPTAVAAFLVQARERSASVFNEARSRLGAAALRAIERPQLRLERVEQMIRVAASGMLERRTRDLDGFGRLIALADPRRILEQGFAVIRDARGIVVTSIAGVERGAGLKMELSDGHVAATVTEVTAS
ncbi:MAG: exodeoxyribonuclease VII large subunit [Acidimicrobiia bacterium]